MDIEEGVQLPMKISDSNLNAVTTSAQQAAQAAAAGAGQSARAAKSESRSDQVQLSDLSSALKSLTGGSPERDARISQLAAAYQSGNYAVNAGAVSQAMVSDAFSGR